MAEKKTETTKEAATAVSATENNAKLVRKISPKAVCGKVTAPTEKKKQLYVVMGQTHGIKLGQGDNGPWCAFLGNFEAINTATGEVFQSGQCFVPKAVEDMLVGSVKAAQGDDENASVQFALEVGVEQDERSATGYVYYVKNLVKTAAADPLAALRAIVHQAVPQLAAPAK